MSRKCRRVAAVVACSRSAGNAAALVCASPISANSENITDPELFIRKDTIYSVG
jgi:hypothetical protein